MARRMAGPRAPVAPCHRWIPSSRRGSVMNHKVIAFVLASALPGLALVGEVVAEPSKPPPAPVAGKATLGVTVEETELVASGWRASKLLSAEVRNDRDEK